MHVYIYYIHALACTSRRVRNMLQNGTNTLLHCLGSLTFTRSAQKYNTWILD